MPIDAANASTKVSEHGEWSDGIVDLMVEIRAGEVLSANDVAQFFLISDGAEQTLVREAILSEDYTKIGLSRKVRQDGADYYYFLNLIMA